MAEPLGAFNPRPSGTCCRSGRRKCWPWWPRGLTSRQIAAELVLSENTIRKHVSHILSKLGLSRRSQAAAYAARRGLLEPPAPGQR
jgi:DNA-binding CsgD family transcriptional regulator